MTPWSKARGYSGAAITLLAITVGWLMIQQPLLRGEIDEANTKTGQLEPQVQTLSENQKLLLEGMTEANRRLRAAGESPVPVPTVAPQLIQPDEFTAEEAAAVRQIIAQQLSQQKVSITQAEISQIARTAAALVPKPKDGKTPTAVEMQRYAQISIAAFCAGDRCRAPVVTPSPGPRGPQGEKGDPAPKITDEELLASAKLALAAYCGLESQPCKGDKGEPGATITGPQGATGRGISSTTCQDDGQWLFRYTDGSTELVDGPCRVIAAPPTGPDPTPAAKKSR